MSTNLKQLMQLFIKGPCGEKSAFIRLWDFYDLLIQMKIKREKMVKKQAGVGGQDQPETCTEKDREPKLANKLATHSQKKTNNTFRGKKLLQLLQACGQSLHTLLLYSVTSPYRSSNDVLGSSKITCSDKLSIFQGETCSHSTAHQCFSSGCLQLQPQQPKPIFHLQVTEVRYMTSLAVTFHSQCSSRLNCAMLIRATMNSLSVSALYLSLLVMLYNICLCFLCVPYQHPAVKASNVKWSQNYDKFDKQQTSFLSYPLVLTARWQHLPSPGRSSALCAVSRCPGLTCGELSFQLLMSFAQEVLLITPLFDCFSVPVI